MHFADALIQSDLHWELNHDPWLLLFKLLELFVQCFIVTANTK